MFVGAVPLTVVSQMLDVARFDEWGKVYVCCSGSFRVDRAIKTRFPDLPVFSNDVSLLSCAVGTIVSGGEPFPIKFTGRLAFVEDIADTFLERVAAVLVGLRMGGFAGKNDYAKRHFEHYADNFATYLVGAMQKVAELTIGFKVDGYYAGDFRDHAQQAIKQGVGIASFAPTYKNGYERLYRFLAQNTEWAAPSYRTWDPKDLGPWLSTVHDSGVPYCVITDHELDGFKAATEFRSTINKPVYGYVRTGKGSFRRKYNRAESFAYEKVDPATLGPLTDVELAPVSSAQMTFLKNVYLAKGIAHATGVANYLVMLDGKLAGGFIYARDRWDPAGAIYLLSDFCIVHERRLAKLIAMLAGSSESIGAWSRRFVVRPTFLRTTAFTDQPVSMKYRGIFELAGRKPGMLNYEAEIRDRTAKAIYLEWLGRFGQVKDPDRPGGARSVAHLEKERALHGRAGVQPARREPAP